MSTASTSAKEGWTTEIPKEDGFYWHRFKPDGEAGIIYLADSEKPKYINMTVCGHDVPWAPYMDERQITGEFYMPKLTLPTTA